MLAANASRYTYYFCQSFGLHLKQQPNCQHRRQPARGTLMDPVLLTNPAGFFKPWIRNCPWGLAFPAKLAESPAQTSTFSSVREADSFLPFPQCSEVNLSNWPCFCLRDRLTGFRRTFSLDKRYG
jgi:hypothetical protein